MCSKIPYGSLLPPALAESLLQQSGQEERRRQREKEEEGRGTLSHSCFSQAPISQKGINFRLTT